MHERDDIRKENPSDPRIKELNKEIDNTIREHKKNKWNEHLQNCQAGTKKLWSTIKNLGSQPVKSINQGIKFGDKVVHDPKKLADKFNAQYTPSSNQHQSKESRRTRRHLKKKPSDPEIKFTPEQTAEAIRKSKNSKALGPDGISPIMLKHLGKSGIRYLTNIINNSVNTAIIPNHWKTARIIPLLKPNKPTDEGKSFRPISLLSPAAKILEALLLPTVSEAANLASHQHGFRKCHSTTTCLQEISDHITKGLNQYKPVERTVLVAIDLSRAFDTVDHNILLKDIYELNLSDRIKRFLCSYLRGRQTYVEFRGSKSKLRKMRQGVPQGGVLSPLLFNIYMSKMPPPPGTVAVKSYADDTTVLNSGDFKTKTVQQTCKEINEYLETLYNWFKNRNLEISPNKSTATVFTTFNQEMKLELPIFIQGTQVPTVQKPKILGVYFDNLFKFGHHADQIKTKVHSRNNILKALCGTTWGKEKETILSTYKAISQSVLNYCSPIWGPNLCDSKWEELQRQQNAALRTATGCTNMTSIDHLHQECKMMPVKEHCDMLSRQFVLTTQLEENPNNINLNAPRPNRRMCKTLQTEHSHDIRNITQNGHTKDQHKSRLKQIHTSSVRNYLNTVSENRVLQNPAPEICPSEKTLPRETRSTLAQLRSGFSSHLNSYLCRIREDIQDICPDCGESGHTTAHLFNCSSKPTSLSPLSLWKQPKDAAQFLGLNIGPVESPTIGLPIDDHG